MSDEQIEIERLRAEERASDTLIARLRAEVRALEEKVEELEDELRGAQNELDAAELHAEEEIKEKVETWRSSVRAFLDELERPVGCLTFRVPSSPRVDRAILGLYDAIELSPEASLL